MSSTQDMFEIASAVTDEKSFLAFLEVLGRDFAEERKIEAANPSNPYGPGALGWENGSIDTFLDAANAWGCATAAGTEFYQTPSNPWSRAAQIICAGKFYE